MLSGRKRLRQLELSSEDEEDGDSMSDAGGKRDETAEKKRSRKDRGALSQSTESADEDVLEFDFMGGKKTHTAAIPERETVVAPAHSPAPLSPPKATERDLLQVEAQPWNCTACTYLNYRGDVCAMCGTRAPRQRACKVPSKKSEKQLTSAHRNIVAETPPADLGRNSKDSSSAAAGTTEKEKQIKAIEIDLTRDEQDDKNKEDEDFIEYIPSPDLLASWKPTAAATAAKNKEKRSRRKRLKDDLQKCTKKAKDE